jgi:hypothetical protein
MFSTFGNSLEVALSEIIFPFGLINVRDGYNQVDIIQVKDEGEEITIDEIVEMPQFGFKINPIFTHPLR